MMERMKKGILAILLCMIVVFAVAGCQNGTEKSGTKKDVADDAKKHIVVGTTDDYTKIGLEASKKTFEDMGYTMEIKVLDDYTMPNKALAEGSIDANFFQHRPYLNMYNDSNDTNLTMIEPLVFNVPNTLYSKKIKSIDNIPVGAKIAVVNDASNIELALKLLQETGVLTLSNKPIDKYYSMADVVDNPQKIQFVEVDYFSINAMIEDVDLIITDAYFQCLYPENADIYSKPLHTLVDKNNTIGLVVRAEDINAKWAKDLNNALRSKTTREKFAELSKMTTVYWAD